MSILSLFLLWAHWFATWGLWAEARAWTLSLVRAAKEHCFLSALAQRKQERVVKVFIPSPVRSDLTWTLKPLADKTTERFRRTQSQGCQRLFKEKRKKYCFKTWLHLLSGEFPLCTWRSQGGSCCGAGSVLTRATRECFLSHRRKGSKQKKKGEHRQHYLLDAD